MDHDNHEVAHGAEEPSNMSKRTCLARVSLALLALLAAAGTVNAAGRTLAATTTVASSPVNPSQIGRPTALVATVTSAASGVVPSGQVKFTDSGADACTATLNKKTGVGSCNWAFSTQGAHKSVVAHYLGDAANLPSDSAAITQTVTVSTTLVTVVPAANPSPVGAAVTLTAVVDGFAVRGETVQFTQDGANLGTPKVLDAGGHATIDSAPLLTAAGHVFGATYAGDANNTAASGQALVNVAAASTSTTITVSANQGTPTTSFSFTATVDGGAPTGSVAFWEGSTLLATRALANHVTQPFSASFAAGEHVVTAVYAGDNTTTPSASAGAAVMVSADGQAAPLAANSWNYGYDALGNLTTITDANAALTARQYDSLSRNTLVTQPAPASGKATPTIATQYGVDAQNARAQVIVTDPRSVQTIYGVDGLGNVPQESSHDAGSTARAYYDNGLLHTSKDARGKLRTYTYDELDRLKTIGYGAGTGTTLTYDEGTYGKGYLTTMADESGSTHWVYDGSGRVRTKTQATGPSARAFTLGYTYGTSGAAAGKLQTITYPSGAVVTYGYDAGGRVDDIRVTTVDGTTTQVLGGVAYTGLDQPLSWVWGTGRVVVQRGYDGYGRLVSYPLGNPLASDSQALGVMRTLSYDAAGRIVAYRHTTPAGWDQNFGYDGLDRLTSAKPASGGGGVTYDYDVTGNRTRTTISGTPYKLTVDPSSNRYTTVQAPVGGGAQGYDAAGHLTSDPSGTYTYSARGRLASEQRSGKTWSYLYNGLEQRTYKSDGGPTITGTSYYVYDEAGRLAGEYDANGAVVYETIRLGDIPVAAVVPPGAGAAAVDFIYADHLDTARVIVRASDHKIVWSWSSSEPFGNVPPLTGLNGLPALTYNPRFPGQVYDAESGWFHNGHRDYDPGKGRYVQSDPLGLGGGIDPYGYVGDEPLLWFDPWGLNYASNWAAGGAVAGGGITLAASIGVDAISGGLNVLATPAEVGAGAALGGAVGYALGSFADWATSGWRNDSIPPSASDTPAAPTATFLDYPARPGTRGVVRCNCKCFANTQAGGPSGTSAEGQGEARNWGDAQRQAEANAKKALGCQAEHCQCACIDSKGEKRKTGGR